jgi:hypothetical protein
VKYFPIAIRQHHKKRVDYVALEMMERVSVRLTGCWWFGKIKEYKNSRNLFPFLRHDKKKTQFNGLVNYLVDFLLLLAFLLHLCVYLPFCTAISTEFMSLESFSLLTNSAFVRSSRHTMKVLFR